MGRKKQRSTLQMAQAARNMAQIHATDKENIPPTVLASSLVEARLETHAQRLRGDEFKRKYNNEHRKQVRSQGAKAALQSKIKDAQIELSAAQNELEETQGQLAKILVRKSVLEKEKDALRKRKDRAPAIKAHAVEKAAEKAKTIHLSENGMFSELSREMVRELVQSGVPVGRIDDAIQAVSTGLGVAVSDSISRRSAARIVLEGGIASKIQIGHEIDNSKGLCISN